ncbi:T-complex protein 1 subunit eta [Cyanidiococcus yangmingshanensis]|uniref:T-complex protein 1 subunit eta n=1 Tax=Cyanidiococcus yangmingshanensis TaxID=2690220 RepID=A0A7J7ILS3_9RHOD|nr:T-complex protein 1 subunit eta [Cyanidiococcus yangmingshanensis]
MAQVSGYPPIIILKDDVDASQGIGQIISNINACEQVVDVLRSTLGPRGMDKLIQGGDGKVTISNDGATILRVLQIVHPAARLLADIAKSQDEEVGDGTTSVVLLAGELLRQAKSFLEDGVHPRVIMSAYRKAYQLIAERLRRIAVDVAPQLSVLMSSERASEADTEAARSILRRCAGTALNSKLIAQYREFFAAIAVDAVLALDADLDLDLIGVKKVNGGSVSDSSLVPGVGFKKTFSYAGFEQQPKKIHRPKILLLNLELELKSEKENAEVRVQSAAAYQQIVDAEWNIIYEKLEKIVATGARVVLSRLAIGDLATQYFADREIFCAGRVPDADLQRVARAVGARVQTTVHDMRIEDALGTCEWFEERQVGAERFNFFTGCKEAKSATILLRGGSEQFLDETERSLHDAIMIVRRTLKYPQLVAGGGAVEMELSKYLREHSRRIQGKAQLLIAAYAKALETIPRTLCENAGFDTTDLMNKLRAKHATSEENQWVGANLETGEPHDCWENYIWEPALIRSNAFAAATEAACTILSVDETLKTETGERDAGAGLVPGHGTGGRHRA